MNPTALIAEDEALLAAHLESELARLWPALRIVAKATHGAQAVDAALALRPDVLFLDIRMPGMSGLEAAEALAEDWPAGTPLPLIVFVTAYDQYALQAFERSAIDYVLKPVVPARLQQTCQRLETALRARGEPNAMAGLDDMLGKLRSVLASGLSADPRAGVPREGDGRSSDSAPLRVIQAGTGTAIHMVPVDEVIYFEAADKYIRVVTTEREHLIRTSLRELLPRLDADRFWQIHRGTVVRADAIVTAERLESGKTVLTLRGHADKLTASRLYAHLFKAM